MVANLLPWTKYVPKITLESTEFYKWFKQPAAAAISHQILNIFPINSKLCIKMGKIWCSISNHQIINKHIPLSLLDKHSEAIHSLFPTLTHRVEVRPFQNQQFWCYSCHPIVNFLVWDLYDCNQKNFFSVLFDIVFFIRSKIIQKFTALLLRPLK